MIWDALYHEMRKISLFLLISLFVHAAEIQKISIKNYQFSHERTVKIVYAQTKV